ncbi:hypothetical protein DUNSADRAFT_15658 [Dunaliella salina]|uniref:MYND-type domain-containing protein n=1 Tax=Dunaliella salina TaxID=3046 RepID=A0ABQ7G506_DUNSA|nr:hypothetical protein DUNSADRAFT_15658 [Dunaliella salina]|eukprot:KAF5829683.1 hypothetical protein DUNSADRAFT_15658 [Dunaliella salina]
MQGPHRLPASEATLRKAVKAYEVISGPGHPDTLRTLDTLAGTLVSQQRDEEAVLVFKTLLTRAEGRLEEEEGHPAPDKACVSLDVSSWMITSLMNLDRYEEAVYHATAMLKSSEEFLGPRHADTCQNKALLRKVELQQAQHAKAMKHMVGADALPARQLSSGDKQGSKKGGSSSDINRPAAEGNSSVPLNSEAESDSIGRGVGGSNAGSSGSSSGSSKVVQSLAGSLLGLSVQEQAQQPQDHQHQSPCKSKKQGESKEGPCMRTCIACHRKGVGMKRCSRCNAAWACGPECFAQAWKNGHKRECVPAQVTQ